VARVEKKGLAEIDQLYDANHIPLLAEFLARRVAAIGTPEALDMALRWSTQKPEVADSKAILRNILAGLKGRGPTAKPPTWDNVVKTQKLFSSPDAELKSLAYSLAVVFGDAKAMAHMRE